MNGSVALNQAKKYTDKSLQGLGSIKGSPCTIKSVTEVNNGTEIIFEWKSQQGISETSTIFVENGVSITDIMKTPIRFCVVRDQFKATALLGALRTGTLTHLVTNDVIANRVLQNMA